MDFVPILRTLSDAIWDSKVKLVRHASSTWDLGVLLRSGHLDEYQSRQARPLFHGVDHLVSFVGEGGRRSRFLGCYCVDGVDDEPGPCPRGFPFPDMDRGAYRYELSRLPEFDELESRLVVDWGGGTRSWVQRLGPKEVIEIGECQGSCRLHVNRDGGWRHRRGC